MVPRAAGDHLGSWNGGPTSSLGVTLMHIDTGKLMVLKTFWVVSSRTRATWTFCVAWSIWFLVVLQYLFWYVHGFLCANQYIANKSSPTSGMNILNHTSAKDWCADVLWGRPRFTAGEIWETLLVSPSWNLGYFPWFQARGPYEKTDRPTRSFLAIACTKNSSYLFEVTHDLVQALAAYWRDQASTQWYRSHPVFADTWPMIPTTMRSAQSH